MVDISAVRSNFRKYNLEADKNIPYTYSSDLASCSLEKEAVIRTSAVPTFGGTCRRATRC